jgi:ABC-type Mn2+/Zn2+ transport system permease subunit
VPLFIFEWSKELLIKIFPVLIEYIKKMILLIHWAILSLVKVSTPFYLDKDSRYQSKKMVGICYGIALALGIYLYSKLNNTG